MLFLHIEKFIAYIDKEAIQHVYILQSKFCTKCDSRCCRKKQNLTNFIDT